MVHGSWVAFLSAIFRFISWCQHGAWYMVHDTVSNVCPALFLVWLIRHGMVHCSVLCPVFFGLLGYVMVYWWWYIVQGKVSDLHAIRSARSLFFCVLLRSFPYVDDCGIE